MPLRLGDGTGLKAKGFTEIRLGDGTIIWAGGPTIVDDFEDNDISEYSGDTADFDVQSTTVYEGSYALEATTSGVNKIVSTSGLENYPAQGDVFSCWVYSTNGFSQWAYGAQDANNWYMTEINEAKDVVKLFIQQSGSFTELASAAVTLDASTWYEVEVDWATDGTQTMTVYDGSGTALQSISATDTTWSSGGVGFRGASGRYFDYYTIK